MVDNGIIDDPDVSHIRYRGVWGGGDAGHFTIEDNVISDNRIGDDLDALSGVPDDIALDDVDPFAAAIDENARIFFADVRIVNNVVANDVSIRAEFELDAVISTVAGAAQVMNIVAFHQRVCGDIRSAVGADVHALSFRRAVVAQARVMDVISSDHEGVTVAAVHRQGIVASPADFALLKGYMMPPDEAHTRAAAPEPYAANSQVRAVDKFNVVISVGIIFGSCENRFFALCGADDNRIFLCAVGGDGSPTVLRIDAAV